MIGAEKGVSALEYNHFEEERIYPKIRASVTTASASEGKAATFTIANADTLLFQKTHLHTEVLQQVQLKAKLMYQEQES
jgi:hypothetical protein